MPTNEEDLAEQRKRRKRRAEKRRRRRQQALIARTIVFVLLVCVLIAVIAVAGRLTRKKQKTDQTGSITNDVVTEGGTAGTESGEASSGQDGAGVEETQEGTAEGSTEGTEEGAGTAEGATAGDYNDVDLSSVPTDRDGILAFARTAWKSYDYDTALAAIQSYEGYGNDNDMTVMISQITAEKSTCSAVNVATTPHVFFHSLLNDSRGLIASATCTEERVEKNNKAMATVAEFKACMEDMYNAGYVLISLDDLVVKTKSDDGKVTMTKNTNLLLPANKKPLIMSEDDLSYYHSYGERGAQGYADRLVVDENGKVKCEFVDVDGVTKIGDYDMVPLIDTFIEEHEGFSYKGARPTIALTGYNGIFGYRTNDYYKEGPDGADLNEAQKNFLRNHPEYDFDTDVAAATKVANALKEAGWTFASHTYGHINASSASLEALQRDHERWKIAVGTCIGETDKIIFAFGGDIGIVNGYTADNEKYQYFKSQGFNIFCNVDGNIGWTEFGNEYVRTGRVALDGVTFYNAMTESATSHRTYSYDFEVLGINNVAQFFDPNRNTDYCQSE